MTPPRRRLPALLFFGAALAAVVGLGAPRAGRLWRAHVLLRDLGGATAREERIATSEVSIAHAGGPIRARLYCAEPCPRAFGMVVAHGIHYRGIDERRLVAFARGLADAGFVVLTPELEELADYRFSRRTEEELAESVRYLSSRSDRVIGPRVGLLGFSFAGGLSLVAAQEADIGARLAWVASVGGYHDLGRVLRFFLENQVETPHGLIPRSAHEYGLAVWLYQSIDRFVPEPDRALMRDAVRAWLHEDRDVARALAARRSTLEAENLFALLESHQLEALRPSLEEALRARAPELEALSPRGKLALIRCPVYLLHGQSDSVIPSSETEWAHLELGRRGHVALVSPLLEHVEVDRPAKLLDRLMLLDFVATLL